MVKPWFVARQSKERQTEAKSHTLYYLGSLNITMMNLCSRFTLQRILWTFHKAVTLTNLEHGSKSETNKTQYRSVEEGNTHWEQEHWSSYLRRSKRRGRIGEERFSDGDGANSKSGNSIKSVRTGKWWWKLLRGSSLLSFQVC